MKPSHLFSHFTVLSTTVLASDIVGVVDFPFTREISTNQRQFTKRSDGEFEVLLDNQIMIYNIELEIGTPAQKITAALDTGSSDLWVMDAHNSQCLGNAPSTNAFAINCTHIPKFDPFQSSTFQNRTDEPFVALYGDFSSAAGFMGSDDISIGGTTIKGANFGVGYTASSRTSVCGIGFTSNEFTTVSMFNPHPFEYPNLPVSMKEQGIIEKVAYSLYLDAFDEKSGHLLFGGVDHAKYYDTLTTLPIVPNDNGAEVNAMYIELTEVVWDNGETNTTLTSGSAPALLDSGTTLNILPPSLIADLNITLQCHTTVHDVSICQCPPTNHESFLRFHFNGAEIALSASDILRPVAKGPSPLSEFGFMEQIDLSAYGDNLCAMWQMPSNKALGIILGDVFLRNTYAVFDLESKEISIAQAKKDVKESNIEVISSTIPSATKDAKATLVTSFAGLSTNVVSSSF